MLQQSKSTQAFNIQQENENRYRSELRSTATAVAALNSVTNKSFSHVYNDDTSGSYDENNFAANDAATATTSRKNKIFDKKYLTKSYLTNKIKTKENHHKNKHQEVTAATTSTTTHQQQLENEMAANKSVVEHHHNHKTMSAKINRKLKAISNLKSSHSINNGKKHHHSHHMQQHGHHFDLNASGHQASAANSLNGLGSNKSGSSSSQTNKDNFNNSSTISLGVNMVCSSLAKTASCHVYGT